MNPVRAQKQGGFSLIEVVISIWMSMIVLLAVGVVLTATQTRWNNAWGKVCLQRDGSYVLLELSHAIKEAASATVGDDGKTIQIYDTDGNWVEYAFQSNTHTLEYNVQGQTTQTLIDGYVEDLTFEVENNKVGIGLTLKQNNKEAHFDSTIQIRNYGL
ncbi:MAG: hypothetical protein JXM79_01990 [Sedimentisphaerales bacterium]|nr:hypothetical protein [Sedimentisphaerales bacterium]